MSGFEALMWDLERDPRLSSSFANLTVFDRPPDRATFRSRMARALDKVPRLRQRVVEGRTPFERPRWVDDDDFDLDHHLRWIDLGGDAGSAELHALTARLSRQPFDRARPLWEFVTIEGLRDGRAAMLQRLHHTITDGEGGIRLSVQFLDVERHPGTPAGEVRPRVVAPPAAEPEPSAAAAPWWRSAPEVARRTVELVGAGASGVVDLPRRGSDLAGLARSTLRQVRVGQRRSPLWTGRSLRRWFGTTALSLEEVRSAAHRLGGSVNDLFITGAASAAGAVHEAAGAPVDQLRVSMPVSTRHDRSAGGNAFSPTQTLVPTAPMDPAVRFGLISEILTEVKAERVIDSLEGAANAAAFLPPVLTLRTGQYLAGSVDFVCSNVRAAPFDLFIGGAFMEANYPIGPLAGTAFNLTTMSYRGWLFMGLVVDPAAVTDPEGLLTQIDAHLRDLLRAGGVRRPSRFPG
jgi:WS/DGAT/MGAT family acyltransferase